MSINNQDFLSIAKDILVSGSDEVHFRTSVSRAYYNLFHQVMDLVGKVPRIDNDGNRLNVGVHMLLIKYLEGEASNDLSLDKKGLCKIANSLKWTKKNREYADYFLNKNVTKLNANQVIDECERVKKLISVLIKSNQSPPLNPCKTEQQLNQLDL